MRSAKTPESVADRNWDVIIVGSGIGGGTAAYALARAGKSVLILERGRLYAHNPGAVFDDLEERRQHARDHDTSTELLKNAGVFWDLVDDVTQKRALSFRPYVGNGVGGSSAIHGMAMERFRPEDFSPGQYFRSVPDANVPEEWPITYAELRPYYIEAEQLYRVRGTPDPLGPKEASHGYMSPPPLSRRNLEIVRTLKENSLHPYYQPMACEYREGCRECPTYICPRACKNDAYRCCIEPAVLEFGAQLLDECEAIHLESDRRKVTAVHCIRRGVRVVVRGQTVVLSAGALQTPALLLRSENAAWPKGVANRHDQVGRNLMRHLVDLYLVRVREAPLKGELTKQVSFNDFYVWNGTKLGNVQTLGPTPPPDVALNLFEISVAHVRPGIGPVLVLARPLVRMFAKRIMSASIVYASILEDLPYSDNRVTFDGARERTCISYRIHEEAIRRLSEFRTLCRKAFEPLQVKRVKLAHNSGNLAHQVGTCRFGTSPENSVLDADCRAHELDNLFCLDGSFMPTSGGINPSLTIAANSLRVAAKIAGKRMHCASELREQLRLNA